jgi:hypothetical protein
LSSHNAAWPVPALFQASELSSAAPSSVSKISMRSDGSSSLRNMAKVALMMPAPTRMMSAWLLEVPFMAVSAVDHFVG